ncbi:unnamed protein product [Caenorhabditis auriculariae]|uniref:Uncharacterized protein n=1 Tax=Caenorhabditis auriculariae TaxID=2777116 RepID=A0A8S1H331_9PELO|nr:unnamed protein product [Caenorhabditis auriculariae]
MKSYSAVRKRSFWMAELTLLLVALFNVLSPALAQNQPSTQVCCKTPMARFSFGERVDQACTHPQCTEGAIILIDSNPSNTGSDVRVNTLKQTSSLKIVNDATGLDFSNVEEINHKWPGPAVHLENANLNAKSFEKLAKINVDDVSKYCASRELVVVIGRVDDAIKKRLEEVAEKALAPCKQISPPPSSTNCITGAGSSEEKEEGRMDLGLVIGISAVVILAILGVSLFIITRKNNTINSLKRDISSGNGRASNTSSAGGKTKGPVAKENSKMSADS